MSNELYDCCGSDTIEATCTAFGSINAVVMGLIVLSWAVLMFKSEWFRHQLLLSFTFLFQLLPALWRTWFYLSAGWKPTSPGTYITIRSSDSGDFVVSLVAFAMYLYQLEQKFSKSVTDPEFDYRKLRKRLAIGFWIFFGLYSCYWGGFYVYSKEERNLAWVDFATSAWFAVLIVVYIVLGTNLIKAINKMLGYGDDADNNAPGVANIIWILVLQCIAMFLRMIFVSLQDVQKLSKIESISKSTSYWPVLMSIQCTTQLFACFVVFLSIYLIKKSEQAIAEEPESRKLSDDYGPANHIE